MGAIKNNFLLYASQSGNTEKVALALKDGFDRHGWHTTMRKLVGEDDAVMDDIVLEDYDFFCVGSPVIRALPLPLVRRALSSRPRGRHKIVPGPKCGLVFCTYGGIHLGPKEAEPTLKLLELELEHLKFKVIGSLAIPGAMGNLFTPEWYHGVMIDRPNQNDLERTKQWIDDLLNEYEESGGKK
jgi:flavodoxin